MEQYQGFYARFDTPSKAVGGQMMGADDLVGDSYEVSLEAENGSMVAWISNKFGAKRGYLNAQDSSTVQLALARGWTVKALLVFVAYSDAPEPGVYWGEVAVFCFAPAVASAVESFMASVGARLAEGVRPRIDLGAEALAKLAADPTWMPSETLPLPKKEKGTAILKDHQSLTDKMVEQGRARNKGCYVVSWAFIIIVVALLAFGACKLFGVL